MNSFRSIQTTGLLRAIVAPGSLVLSLLLLSSGWASEADEMIDAETGKALLKKHCSQCHGVPSGSKHKPGDWKNVVLRMQSHRQKRGFKGLSQLEITQVSKFLDQTSITDTKHSNRNNGQ